MSPRIINYKGMLTCPGGADREAAANAGFPFSIVLGHVPTQVSSDISWTCKRMTSSLTLRLLGFAMN